MAIDLVLKIDSYLGIDKLETEINNEIALQSEEYNLINIISLIDSTAVENEGTEDEIIEYRYNHLLCFEKKDGTK